MTPTRLKTLPLLLLLSTACGLQVAPPKGSDTASGGGGGELQVGDLSISPGTVDFGTVSPGEPSSADVVITNTGSGSVVLVESVVRGDSAFSILSTTTFPVELLSEDSLVVSVGFEPATAATFTGSLDIEVGNTQQVASVPLTGTASSGGSDGSDGGDGADGTDGGDGSDGGGDCHLGLSQSAVDFSDVYLYTTATQSVTLTNDCTGDILVQDVVIGEDTFSFSGLTLPQVIGSGATDTLILAFSPTTIGSYSDTIQLVTDETTGNTYDVSVQGKGVEPPCYVCDPTIEVDTGGTSDYEVGLGSIFGIPASQSVIITNASDVDLEILGYDFQNDAQGGTFTISGLNTATMSPRSTLTFTINYTCPEFCLDIANTITDENILHILSNDPAQPDYAIAVQGI